MGLKDAKNDKFKSLEFKAASHRQKVRPILTNVIKDHIDTEILPIFGSTSISFNYLNQQKSQNTFIISISSDKYEKAIEERLKAKKIYNNVDYIISNKNCLRNSLTTKILDQSKSYSVKESDLNEFSILIDNEDHDDKTKIFETEIGKVAKF